MIINLNFTTMKQMIYGVVVEEYPQYKFRTVACYAEQAENNIRRFLNKPFAKCEVVSCSKTSYVRENECCRMRVAVQ